VKLGGRQHRLWLWWWDLPGSHWWFPYKILWHDVYWDTNGRGPVAWPGMIRCLFQPHADDSYGNCCYCGASRKPGKGRWRGGHQ